MPRFAAGAGIAVRFQRNVRAFGQAADGVGKIDVLVFLDEGENIAALVAAEAMEDLPVAG